MIGDVISTIMTAICATPASAMVGMGLLLLCFGLPLMSIEIVLFGVCIGTVPGLMLFMSRDSGVGVPFLPHQAALLLILIGAFSGGYLAFTARKAIKFILVGIAWLLLISLIWPDAFYEPFGGMVALIGFFVAGYFSDHLFIIATSIEGAFLLVLAFLEILADNYPQSFWSVSAYTATLFVVGATIAFGGCIIQGWTTARIREQNQGSDVSFDPDNVQVAPI